MREASTFLLTAIRRTGRPLAAASALALRSLRFQQSSWISNQSKFVRLRRMCRRFEKPERSVHLVREHRKRRNGKQAASLTDLDKEKGRSEDRPSNLFN